MQDFFNTEAGPANIGGNPDVLTHDQQMAEAYVDDLIRSAQIREDPEAIAELMGIRNSIRNGGVLPPNAAAGLERWEQKRVAMDEALDAAEAAAQASAAGNLAVTSGDVLRQTDVWRNDYIDALKQSGEYRTSLEGFGASGTESIFNKAIGDLDAQIAAAPGAQKEALLAQRAELIAEQVATNERHTVQSYVIWEKANPELAATMKHMDAPPLIDAELAGLPDGPNKDALKVVKMGDLVELEAKKARGEQLSPEMEQRLAQNQAWLDTLTPEQKREITQASTDLAKEREKVQEQDKGLVAGKVADINADIARILGVSPAQQQGQEVETRQAQQPQPEKAVHPLADLFGDVQKGDLGSIMAAFASVSVTQETFANGWPPHGPSNARADNQPQPTRDRGGVLSA